MPTDLRQPPPDTRTPEQRARHNLSGMRFGILTAISIAERPSDGQGLHWLCKCDCGRESTARAKDLRNGNTASCGCMQGPRGQQSKGVPTLPINRPWRKDATATQADSPQA